MILAVEAILWASVFVLLVVLSGFFSGVAAALIAVNRFRLRHQQEGDTRVQRVVALFENAQEVLAVSLIGSTIANVAALVAFTLLLSALFAVEGAPLGWGIALLALVIVTPILLLFGEVAPRRFFRERADRLVFWLYRPIRWSLVVLGPFARVGIWLAQEVTRRNLPPAALTRNEPWQPLVEPDDLASPPAVRDEETSESRMIHGIFDLQKTRVREVMRPLVDLVAVRLPERIGSVRALARETGYSRFPVYRDRVTNLTGYLDIYALLAVDSPDEAPVGRYCREAYYVPETIRLDDLLQEMLRGHHKVAIVVDEYGGCSGWVTREDLLEEIVGEIEDEFDKVHEPIRRIDERAYLVSAAIDIDDLNEQLGLRLPCDEYDTLGGFVYTVLGRIPKEGDTFEDAGIRFEVSEMDSRRIVTVRITIPVSESSPTNGP